MRKKLAVLIGWVVGMVLIAFALSCDMPERKWSETLNENGTIVAKEFKAQVNGSVTTVNMDMDGNLGIGVGSVHVAEGFDVVIQCDHGDIFTVNKKNVYAKVKVDDKVVITYRERYKEWEDGRTEHVGYDFIDANTVNQ